MFSRGFQCSSGSPSAAISHASGLQLAKMSYENKLTRQAIKKLSGDTGQGLVSDIVVFRLCRMRVRGRGLCAYLEDLDLALDWMSKMQDKAGV